MGAKKVACPCATKSSRQNSKEAREVQRASGRQADSPALNLKVRFLRELAQSLLEELRGLSRTGRQLRIEQGIDLYAEVSRFEIELICCALQHTGGHQIRAARLLGLKTTTLNNKIKHYKIDVHRATDAAAAAQQPQRKLAGTTAGRANKRKLPNVAARRRKEDAHLIG
jgi:DNA-binding protein Fis